VAALVVVTLWAGPAAAATGSVQIVRGGLGEGTITSSPAGIDCTFGPDGPSGACEATFEEGTKVRLKGDAAANSKFLGWAPTRTCPKPSFITEPSEFLLQAIPEGSGTAASSGDGISTSCTSDVDAGTVTGVCAAIYPVGTVVTLTATPAAGWTFTGWRTETAKDKDDDCADGTVTMDQRERCIAVFVRT
jgi:Divergent InlB B-repeat domain